MSKSGKMEYPENNVDQENVQWFENYEKYNKTKYFEKLKKKDILNYIKNIEQKCRLEVSSDDEDYASTKKSSTCSLKCSTGTKSKSLNEIKSKVTSKNKKKLTLKKKKKQSFNHDVTNACNYYCLAQKSYFHNNFNYNVQKNSEKSLHTFTKLLPCKSVYQNLNLSRNSYKYYKSSPAFSRWYSKKSYGTYPEITKMASFDVTKDSSQNATHDFRNKRSNITNRKSAKNHAFKSPRRNKFNCSRYINIYPSTNEKMTGRNLSCYDYKRETKTQMRKLNEESSDSDFENQQPVNKIYSERDAMFSHRAPLPKGSYKGCYTARYRYPPKKFRQPTSWSLNSRSNRLTELARLPETSSLLLQRPTSQWENEIELPVKAPSYVMEASINRSYQRETNRKNNMDQRRRRAAVLGDRESLCYRNSDLLRKSRKLYPQKVAPTREDKQSLGCYYDERDEATDGSRYCCCELNANNLNQLRSENRTISISKRVNYTEASLCRTLSKLLQSRDAAKLTCECKEPFHDPPAACLTGSCTCIENTEKNSDSLRETPDTVYCCCCCSCSSSTFHNEKNPVKKLESFCEKVKAVNQDIFHKSSKSTCRNITRTNLRKYARSDSDEQDQYEFNAEKGIRGIKSMGREWLTDPSRLRLEKLERSYNGENLEKILIYPPQGEGGPPLTLYKRSSNISCRVRGDADTGFCYNVIYVQKFVSPKWMPQLSPEILSRDKKCNCSADYG